MAELPILGRCSDAPRSTEASTMSSAESRSRRSLPRFTWRRLYKVAQWEKENQNFKVPLPQGIGMPP